MQEAETEGRSCHDLGRDKVAEYRADVPQASSVIAGSHVAIA